MIVYTTGLLTAISSWTSDPQSVENADAITGTVYADQAGTLYVEQSNFDGSWDVSSQISVSAASGFGFKEPAVAKLWRIRFVNGAVDQGEFRLYAKNRVYAV
jgi:hypothetical protein